MMPQPPSDDQARFSMQQTFVFMCRDLFEDIADISMLDHERTVLDGLLDSSLSLTRYDRTIMESYDRLLEAMSAKTYSLFARHFDDVFLDGLLKRILSLKDICSNLLK